MLESPPTILGRILNFLNPNELQSVQKTCKLLQFHALEELIRKCRQCNTDIFPELKIETHSAFELRKKTIKYLKDHVEQETLSFALIRAILQRQPLPFIKMFLDAGAIPNQELETTLLNRVTGLSLPASINRPECLDFYDDAFIKSRIRNAIESDEAMEDESIKSLFNEQELNGLDTIPPMGSKQWLELFPYQFSKKRGLVPPDEKGEFFYVDPGPFQSRFIETLPPAPYRVVVNIPFYAGFPRSIDEVIQVFENTGFGPNREQSQKKASASLVFVLGFNQMESLDPEQNTAIQRKLSEPVNTSCEVHRFGFYWRPRWNNAEGKSISFEEVRKRYLEIKRDNPLLAQGILREIKSRASSIAPFREIREIVKQHTYTSNMAKIFREGDPDTPVYLGLFDPDTISASQVFDTYTNLIQNFRESHAGIAPTVLSTGYRLRILDPEQHDSPLYALAVDQDMAVRHATATYVKNGTYYPEPNILVLFNSDTMVESFLEGSTLQEQKEYTDPYESPAFMEDIVSKRGIHPNEHLIYEALNPVITTMPSRMQYELGSKNEKIKIFSGQFNKEQKIVRWRISDLRYLIETSQSHALPSAWAGRLLRSSTEWTKRTLCIIVKSSKKQYPLKNLYVHIEKALQVFFEQLDPLSMLKASSESDVRPEIKRFSEIIARYAEIAPKTRLWEEESEEQIKKKGEELTCKLFATSHKQLECVLRGLPNEDIQAFILYTLGKELGSQFICAGYASTAALVNLYRDKLDYHFPELCEETLVSFYGECMQKTGQNYAADKSFTKAQLTILGGEYNSDSPHFSDEELLEKGKFNLNGLHVAALVGDYKLVTNALMSVSRDEEADGHILPLHCAILYLIQHGVSETNKNDLPLITALVSEKTHLTKTDMGLTAIGLAITRLENAGSVVKQCMYGWDVPYFVHFNIEDMARWASLKERQTPLLAMMNKLGKHSGYKGSTYTPRSLLECEKHGFSFFDIGWIENRFLKDSETEKLEEILTSTLAESIRQDDFGTFNIIKEDCMQLGHAVRPTMVDRDGRPLAISAVVNTTHPTVWLEGLKILGLPLAVVDEADGSPILHEAIFPAASRRLGGAKDKRRYFEGFEAYLVHMQNKTAPTITRMLAIEMLLKEPNIDIDQKDRAGDCPLDIALSVHYPHVVWMLLQAKARFSHYSQAQKNQLVQALGLLYLRGDIDDDVLKKVVPKHPDYPLIKKELRQIILQIRINASPELFFSEILENFEKLFEWVEKNNPAQSLTTLQAYIEFSFQHYLLHYDDAKWFLRMPIPRQFQEFTRLHSQQLNLYRKISQFMIGRENIIATSLRKIVKASQPASVEKKPKPKKNAQRKANRKKNSTEKNSKPIVEAPSLQQRLVDQIFGQFCQKYADRIFSITDEENIQKYIAALVQAALERTSSLPVLKFTKSNFISIDPMIYLLNRFIQNSAIAAEVEHLTKGDILGWIRNGDQPSTRLATSIWNKIHNLSMHQRLILPINIHNAHFTLLAIMKNSQNALVAVYLDSFGDYDQTSADIEKFLSGAQIHLTKLTRVYQRNNNCSIQVFEAAKILLEASEDNFNATYLENQIVSMGLNDEHIETQKRLDFALNVIKDEEHFLNAYSQIIIDEELAKLA